MEKEDLLVIQRIANDDKRALDQLYKDYRNPFLIYFKRYAIPEEEIKDLYQETIVAFYQSVLMGKIENISSSIKTYIFGIGKNKAIDHIRKTKKSIGLLAIDKDGEYEEIDLEEKGLSKYQRKLRNSFKQLGESCRNMLTMFYYRGLDISDIVDLGGYKDANTVKSHKSRCLKQLRSLVNK